MVSLTPSESEIHGAICEYLTLRRHFFVRLNNIPAVFRGNDKQIHFRKMGKYARPGLADLLVVHVGRPLFLDVKKDRAYQSPDQREFERGVKAAGAEYYVVRSLDDVQGIGL